MTTKEFKRALALLVKNDYGFEVFNTNKHLFRFSFYHLNSTYNAFCTSVYYGNKWSESTVEWQYATKNKKIEKIVKKVVDFAVEYYQKYGNFDLVEQEIEYYKKLSDMVFEAKYSLNTMFHTEEL